MVTRWIFVGIIICVILQRLFELRISQRNATEILAQGGQEYSDNLLGVVKILQVSWWVAMIAEVWYFDRAFILSLAVIGLIATIAGQVLRYLSMQALGNRWTLAIMTIPGLPLVDTGIYRYLRHPNWLGVILEIFGLPLIHNAYLTAIVFSLANGLLMIQRIQTEEKALSDNS
ncbi:isoprenylcysteine carboxylmethyltransferase family protein [Crocosphaera sp. UHCC 0190]|uniref:isoprenylcysteine carboxyl methyltransferase family protein n=1 Tax=Crocosphaera sp. UHCC 0190 TaxID=3110246 RepID=UPI002B21762D|nr:isoprenylcysteine carboxylmethyltransferase family protein [Crocosphaera sp. UHCC 0190]MEA5509998.1 isoprenylcysteine carboxylmethyltransferase family protein [Crocosphaera sp. UHCC 0190]